ncbi:BA14K family protein [Xanthobacteraceae bacterium Astr-EGSB]|uniref:BA14K family protein n=1 Tax=Astrobacterium formosum TaxID=3069710 RepID=UPI0027B1824B|nr:BA14K family protein [Xanthobacteraceae bacterium Astr-EGSB]
MRLITTLTMTAALIGSAVLFADRAASAAPIANGASTMSQQASQLADTLHVQVQRGPRGVRVGPGPRGPRGGPGPRGGWRGGGGGGAVAAGIAGGLMLGIIAAEQARAASQRDALIAQCARRFRSYDPQTQTYVGRGGRIYSCP